MRRNEHCDAAGPAPLGHGADELVARDIVDAAYQVHSGIGPGLLESAYEAFLEAQLRSMGLDVLRQLKVPAEFRGVRVEIAFRADLIVESSVIVEVKAVELLRPVHTRQLLTYLRLTNLRLGLLVNFNEATFKRGVCRVVNGY